MPSPLSISHIFHRLCPEREKARWEYPFKLSKSHSAVLSNVIFFLLEVNRSIRCTVNDKKKSTPRNSVAIKKKKRLHTERIYRGDNFKVTSIYNFVGLHYSS